MPAWGMHVYIANEVIKKCNKKINVDEFILGNILPDLYAGWIIKDVSKKIPYEITHIGENVILNGNDYTLPNLEKFNELYYKDFSCSLILGYYAHLLADYTINHYAFENHYIKKDNNFIGIRDKEGNIFNCDVDFARICKQNDLALFSNELLSRMDKINISFDNYGILEKIHILEFEYEDVIKAVNYLNEMFEIKKEDILQLDNVYRMFLKSELKDLTDDIINKIVRKIGEVYE